MTSRNARETSAATPSALPPVPPLCCDLCEWPMTADHLVREADGSFRGLLICSQCLEDEACAQADNARSCMVVVGASL